MPAGLAVDSNGNPTIDPTKNVLQLVEAAVKRMDDLLIAAVIRMNDIHELAFKRTDDLRGAEFTRVNELMGLRATYEEKLRDAEAKRIDAIRAVDVNAVNVAANRQADQANVLAAQVAASAEALRSLVASTAASQATAQQQVIGPILERIASIEKAQYEGFGKAGVVDPQMTQLLVEMQAMRTIQSQNYGAANQRTETKDDTRLIFTIIGGILAAIGTYLATR